MHRYKGFDQGIKFANDYWNAHTGRYNKTFPSQFVHRGDSWSRGFAEGLITGRSEKIKEVFKKYKPYDSISWENGKVTVYQPKK